MDVLLNWLWQGTIVALAASAALRTIAPARPQTRYATFGSALVLVAILPAVPLVWSATPLSTESTLPPAPEPLASLPEAWWTSTRVVAACWMVWVALATTRAGRGLLALRRARREATPLAPAREARLAGWMRLRASGRRTRIVVSSRVRAAAVLGCRSPVIAVAPPLLDALTDAEIDRVIVHEWAHVQRRDDLAHALQSLIYLAVGWHPAVAWLDRQVRLEREIACDETAVAVTGSAKAYAASLTKLTALPRPSSRALHAPSALSRSGLRRRIVRILAIDATSAARPPRRLALAVTLPVGAIAMAVGSWPAVQRAGPAEHPTATARAVVAKATTAAPTVDSDPMAAPPPPATEAPLRRRRAAAQAQPRERPPEKLRTGAGPAAILGPPVHLSAPPLSFGPALLARPSLSADVAALAQLELTRTRHLAPEPDSSRLQQEQQEATDDDAWPAAWDAAAQAGIAVGGGSKRAALSTAGFFTRFARKVAGSFTH